MYKEHNLQRNTGPVYRVHVHGACVRSTRGLCTEYMGSVYRGHRVCVQRTWGLCMEDIGSVYRGHGVCVHKTLTGAVCTRHSRGLCAQDTHGGCADWYWLACCVSCFTAAWIDSIHGNSVIHGRHHGNTYLQLSVLLYTSL